MMAKLEQVIVGECDCGTGIEADPSRMVMYIFRPDGTQLAHVDSWRESQDRRVVEWAKQLAGLCRTLQAKVNGPAIDVAAFEAAIDLIEKYSAR